MTRALSAGACLWALMLGGAGETQAQVADLDVRTTVFTEPSPDSEMTVLNPSIRLSVTPWDALSVHAGYEADIVSGASEPTKSGGISPDIVSHASVTDVRHVASGGITLRRKETTLSVSYGYGTESDYRSQSISVSGATEFLKRNTRLELSYSRGFDQVCNINYAASLSPTLRPRLDSSTGCFTSADDRQTDDVDLDSFQGAWTQTWTPVLATQLVLTGGLQHGFLGNPYRAVVIGPGGQLAQEHHPENRARGAAALRMRYYIKGMDTAVGLGVRGYSDTWDVLSQTYELEAERYLLKWLRLLVRGRYYRQSGALFWSDDYTGGEPKSGPRGQYWTGDRELSPLSSYLLGGRVLMNFHGRPGDRVIGMFLDLDASFGLDVIKTNLDEFTWAGGEVNDTFATVASVGLGASF
ncbi:MAG: DUF3570 domain-containing protein [Myxococcales bacterium]|nr:DUF3570 domain-containing protein [Myxococcales bacterium]